MAAENEGEGLVWIIANSWNDTKLMYIRSEYNAISEDEEQEQEQEQEIEERSTDRAVKCRYISRTFVHRSSNLRRTTVPLQPL